MSEDSIAHPVQRALYVSLVTVQDQENYSQRDSDGAPTTRSRLNLEDIKVVLDPVCLTL